MSGGVDSISRKRNFAGWRPIVFLLIALAATAGIRQLALQQQAGDLPGRISQLALAGLIETDERFDKVQLDVQQVGEAVARDERLAAALRNLDGDLTGEAHHTIVSYFSGLSLPEWISVELYDPSPRLLAWTGPTFPLDSAPSKPSFLETLQTAIARDADRRVGLSIWIPVYDGVEVVGAVRAVRTLAFDSPVRNRFLRDYRIEEQWQRLIGYPIELAYPEEGFSTTRPRSFERTLFGIDGSPLAVAVITPPSEDQILDRTRRKYDHVIAFWLAVLAIWILITTWVWFRKFVRHRHAPPAFLVVRNTGIFIFIAIVIRYLLLELDIPSRFQQGKAPLAPLFDASHLASRYGFGAMRSAGDTILTSVFILFVAAAVFLAVAAYLRRLHRQKEDMANHSVGRKLVVASGAMAITAGVVTLLSDTLHRVVLDSTLDYFARSGLLPDNLVILVFAASMTFTFAAFVIVASSLAVAMGTAFDSTRINENLAYLAGGWLLLLLLYAPVRDFMAMDSMSFASYLVFITAAFAGGWFLYDRRGASYDWLKLRTILPAVFLLTLVTYPFLFDGMNERVRSSMMDAADFFDDGEDPRVTFALERLLDDVRESSNVREALTQDLPRARVDSLMNAEARGTLFASLSGYDLTLTVLSLDGSPRGRFFAADQTLSRDLLDATEADDFRIVSLMYAEAGNRDPLVETMTGRLEPERFRYQGLSMVTSESDTLGWLLARAEPKTILTDNRTPFPNVLIPSSVSNDIGPDISLAEFKENVLIRNVGESFGRFRVGDDVYSRVLLNGELWMEERLRDREFLTYYRLNSRFDGATPPSTLGSASGPSIVAARIASPNTFDHLYYLLRLTVAGLAISIPVYLFGLMHRRRLGLVPARRVRFRDKVLNAFFAVGLVTVVTMGFVGLQVVTEENDRAIQSWLSQHLERVESTLLLDSRVGELPARTLDRMSIDSLSARVGLDLNVYKGTELVESSRPQLVRDKLISSRLPMAVYEALHYDGFRFVTADEKIGAFDYTAGYRALPDESGRPAYIISVPTLPEQERIEEERARTVAYLFGSLLLLVLVVMVTASLLANALARPIGRLREGLAAVARGRYTQIPTLKTRDELGELVTTFNDMQEQLAESRRVLATQERQLAWREMARQVAHEIKNPLTPMKLSVQHLRRNMENTDDTEIERFRSDFERITKTLIEQIDTLARIANEFSTFARMPSRVLEELDLNAVVQEAVALMQAEHNLTIKTDLADEPLWVSADREELRRIYINLIKNAEQSIPDGRRGLVSVHTRIDEDGKAVFSSITDNGSGIAPEVQDKIFVPNFSTKTSGTGLGLAIARKSIEELKGQIDFETEQDVGTTFWIRLPRIDTASI